MPENTAFEPDNQLSTAKVRASLPTTLEEARELTDGVSRALRRAARKARAPARIISGGAGVRGRKGDRAFRIGIIASFLALFVLPMLAESVYWGLIASKQYSTQFKFAIRAGQASPLDSLGGLFGLGATQQAQDTQIVTDYIKGRAMIEALDRVLDLRGIYGRNDIDYFSRFNPEKSVEEFEKYWRKRVDAKVETLTGIVDVDVRAFTPEDSLAIAQRILSYAEALVNDLSSRSRNDALIQARSELDRSEKRLQDATAAMRDVRNTEHVLDAKASAEALEKVVTALRLQQLKLEQDLQANGGDDSPQARVLLARISAVKKQISNYSNQIAGVSDAGPLAAGGTLADRMSALSVKQIELDFARQQYAQASAIYQNARVNLQTQQAYLVTSQRPTLAQESTYPRRWWEWSIIVVPALLIWAICVALAFLARDHMAR